MPELQDRLAKLTLRLDRMGMRVEQAVADVLRAMDVSDAQAGLEIDEKDSIIDREEVEIEQECVRLLALYQPAAVDLRVICTVIKVNSDLERIADLAASMGRRIKRLVAHDITLTGQGDFEALRRATLAQLGKTARMLSTSNAETARGVIEGDKLVDEYYGKFLRTMLNSESGPDAPERIVSIVQFAKALERIGDHCTNIAEDIIFLATGDLIRHADAFDDEQERT